MRKLLLGLAALALAAGAASAQTPVQQSAARLDASQFVAIGTNYGTVNSASVATVTVGAGLYAYITNIVIEACGDGSANGAAVTNALFTTTGIVGTPSWQWSQPTTAYTICNKLTDGPFATPLKSASSGVNVVLTSPTAPTHTAYNMKIYYYLAP